MHATAHENAYPGGRVTSARRALATAAAGFERAFTVEELAEAAREIEPDAGSTATAYRAVAMMESSGFLEHVGERDGRALYQHCQAAEHHHHIVCESCGRTAPAACTIDAQAAKAAAETGFVVTRHAVTLYGLCPDCARGGVR